jgi:hypothetical protein
VKQGNPETRERTKTTPAETIQACGPDSSRARLQWPEMQLAGGMRLSKWIKVVGISKMTAWRWRKDGKLKVVFRYGMAYVTADTIQKFFTDDGTAPQEPPCRRHSSAGT